MKDDEKQFLIDLYTKNIDVDGYILCTPRDLINSPDFYIPYKRAWYILDKWSGKDWYDWGTCLDTGWLTDLGKQKAQELIQESQLLHAKAVELASLSR